MRVNEYRNSIIASGRFWQIVMLAAAGSIGTAAHAEGYYSYWQDSEPGFYRPAPMFGMQRPMFEERARHSKKRAIEKVPAAKPQGPLIIAVSIKKQQVKIYDANGFFAEAPVSTGMSGHGTPMGVFSIIQKQKFHRSNIYSGAPMPFMERITWSGIALHAGVLPGYPASHGCIRMPPDFAVKMYGWTRLGARVLVVPGELSPESFSHPFLPSLKVQPQPAVAQDPQPDTPAAPKADKGAPEIKADASEPSLQLRPTVGHGGATSAPLRTADANNDAAIKLPDASSAGSDITVGASVETTATITAPANGDPANADDTQKADAPAAATAPAAAGTTADPGEITKDQARAGDDIAAKLDLIKPHGQIAVFISRKDSKLYVRQNFMPLFDIPVTIASSDRPLGTHVFTAAVDKKDNNELHWSVLSLPVSTGGIERASRTKQVTDRSWHRHKGAPIAAGEKKLPAPDTPAEALDRISVPAEIMARLAQAMTTGSSIIVSDQGINQGETGDGTDFIVSLR